MQSTPNGLGVGCRTGLPLTLLVGLLMDALVALRLFLPCFANRSLVGLLIYLLLQTRVSGAGDVGGTCFSSNRSKRKSCESN